MLMQPLRCCCCCCCWRSCFFNHRHTTAATSAASSAAHLWSGVEWSRVECSVVLLLLCLQVATGLPVRWRASFKLASYNPGRSQLYHLYAADLPGWPLAYTPPRCTDKTCPLLAFCCRCPRLKTAAAATKKDRLSRRSFIVL